MEAIVYPDGEVYTEMVGWKSDDFLQFNCESNPWVIKENIRAQFGDGKQAVSVLNEVLEIVRSYEYVD